MIIKKIKKDILMSKKGNPYAKIAVQFDEYVDGKGNMRWVGGFANRRSWAWKVGDDVAPEVTEEGKYLNFTFGDDNDKLDVYKLPATVGFVLELLGGKKNYDGVDSTRPQQPQAQEHPKEEAIEYPEDEINPEDIPF